MGQFASLKVIERFFSPKSIAVIGASESPQRFGYDIMRNLIESGFKGSIYPVSLKETAVFNIRAHKSVLEIPESIELAIVIIPAASVPSAIEECGRKGIKAASILSGGFSEAGQMGAELEKAVMKIAKKYGIRIVGPNCVGTMNTHKDLNASFIMYPFRGSMGFITQSGALGASVAYVSKRERIGFSKFVNLGNACDVSVPEMMRYYATDRDTKVIGIYLEGVKDGREFVDAIGEVTLVKPMVVVKAGRTDVGAKAVTSHTGSLAGSDRIYESLFKQKGVVRADTLFELIEVARAFTKQPLPRGRRIGVVTNAGGAGVLAVDACARNGLVVPPLAKETVDKLRSFLPPVAGTSNPVDIIASANKECYAKTTEAVAADNCVDALIVNCVVPTFLGMKPSEHAEGVVHAYHKSVKELGKPIICCWMAGELAERGREILEKQDIPSYASPERAAFVLSHMAHYREFVDRANVARSKK